MLYHCRKCEFFWQNFFLEEFLQLIYSPWNRNFSPGEISPFHQILDKFCQVEFFLPTCAQEIDPRLHPSNLTVYISTWLILNKSVLNWTLVCQLHWKTQLHDKIFVANWLEWYFILWYPFSVTLFIQLQPLKCAVPLDKSTIILLSNIIQMQNSISFANTLAYYPKLPL